MKAVSEHIDPDRIYEQIISCILDIGELLLTSGAEIMRCEDTISRLCKSYEFEDVDVFTITSSIVITVTTKEGRIFTQTRRIKSRDTNLDMVARANALSRKICVSPLPPQELKNAVKDLGNEKTYPPLLVFLFYGLIGGSFAMIFNGDFHDAGGGFITALILYLVIRAGKAINLNSILLVGIGSASAALCATLLVDMGIGHNADKIIIGNIMLLIPGLAITTSLRDMINGDTISGMLGFSEAIIKAVSIAVGSAIVLLAFGG